MVTQGHQAILGFKAQKISEWEALSRDSRNAVLASKERCPLCGNFEGGFIYGDAGNITCPCMGYRLFASQFEALVPRNYRHMASGLKPSDKSVTSPGFQAKVIELVRSKPDASYAFYGEAGVGKTSVTIWLLIQALHQYYIMGHRAAPVRSSVSALVDAYHDFVTDDSGEVPEPRITTRNPVVFLAEMDKLGTLTDYRYKVLFELMDSLYERAPRCQLVIDTNLDRPGFQEYFTDKIARRLTELCYRVDYFTEEILSPTEESMR